MAVTVAGIKVPRAEASAFGVITPASDGSRVERFLEKPSDPPGLPDDPTKVFASMGNYLFSTKVLVDALHQDAEDDGSVHDMGGSILPMLTGRGVAHVYDFDDNHVPGETRRERGYWRDVGSWTVTTRPTWTSSPSSHCSASTTIAGPCTPMRATRLRPGSSPEAS